MQPCRDAHAGRAPCPYFISGRRCGPAGACGCCARRGGCAAASEPARPSSPLPPLPPPRPPAPSDLLLRGAAKGRKPPPMGSGGRWFEGMQALRPLRASIRVGGAAYPGQAVAAVCNGRVIRRNPGVTQGNAGAPDGTAASALPGARARTRCVLFPLPGPRSGGRARGSVGGRRLRRSRHPGGPENPGRFNSRGLILLNRKEPTKSII